MKGDVESFGTTDGCVSRVHLMHDDRGSVNHSATCKRRAQELLEKDEVGRVNLELKMLRKRARALTVMVTLLRKYTRGQVVKSVIVTN